MNKKKKARQIFILRAHAKFLTKLDRFDHDFIGYLSLKGWSKYLVWKIRDMFPKIDWDLMEIDLEKFNKSCRDCYIEGFNGVKLYEEDIGWVVVKHVLDEYYSNRDTPWMA